jgi:hypothetical protein
MTAEEPKDSVPKRGFSGRAGKIVAGLALVSVILGSAATIKENWLKLWGSNDPPPKFSLIEPLISLSAAIPPIKFSKAYIPGVEYREDKPSPQELSGERFVIDLGKLHEGDGLAAVIGDEDATDVATAAANVLTAPLKPHENVVTAPLKIVDPSHEGAVGLLRTFSQDFGPYHFAIVDPAYFRESASWTFLRVAVKKETDPGIGDCRVRLIDPAGKMQTSANRVDLAQGAWTNYYDFGLVLIGAKPGAKLKAVLFCENSGHSAGSELVPVTVKR